MSVSGQSGRGRKRKTWKECITEDIKKLNLRREGAQDRGLWRNDILGNRPTRAGGETWTLKR